jgi:hypothetical protein
MVRRLGIFLAAAAFIFGGLNLLPPGPLFAQGPDGLIAEITSPGSGEQLFGQINIVGSAAHPTAFASYTLEYDNLNEPAEQWFLVQERVTQQVQDGVLGAWNTSLVPDGAYQLRLRVVMTTGEIGEFVVSNLRVINSGPTPIPTASGLGASAVEPTPGPSPTSPIVQPPSNNPAPESLAGLDDPGGEPVEPAAANIEPASEPQARINLGRVRSAFCAGAYLAVILFAIMLGYLVVRRRLQPYTQRTAWTSRDDYDDQ